MAGFIAACGILKRQKLSDLGNAWAYYRSPPPHAPAIFQATCKTNCHLDAKIQFLGVWDTVGALGIPAQLLAAENEKRYAFHDTSPCSIILHGCHALAIDEHRDQFIPTLWTGKAPEGVTIEQVWFSGSHSDVGGGYATRTLADIPLVWMAQRAEASGLVLDWSCLPDPKKLNLFAPIHDSRTGLFTMDRLRPTFREIAETPCDVSLYERLYAPVDAAGVLMPTINQGIHRSAIMRYGREASFCSIDEKGVCEEQIYEARNLTPFFDNERVFIGTVPVVD